MINTDSYSLLVRSPRCRRLRSVLATLVIASVPVSTAQAAIGWRAASTANSGTGTPSTLAINKPSGMVSGMVSGDVMLAQVSVGTTVTISAPSGWTLVRSVLDGAYRGSVYWKLAGASEPTSYTWTLSGGAKVAGGIVAFSGVDAATPIQGEDGSAESTAQAAHTTPTIATTGSATWLVSLFGDRTDPGSTWTSAGATERVDARASGAAAPSVAIYTQGPVAAGNYSRTATANLGSGAASMEIIALNASGGGGPEINVTGNSATIADGDTTPTTADHTDFGSVAVSGATVTRTFTVQNTGTASLSVGSVSISGTHAADFSVTAQPGTSVAAGGNTTFNVRFDPGATGTRTASLSFGNGDANENPYNFSIQGSGTASAPAAPSGLTATTISSTQINLAWSDNASNETGFKIDRKTGAGGTWAEITPSPAAGANATTFNQTGLSASTTYYFRVRATNASGDSANSNEANATTSAGGPVTLPFFGEWYGGSAGAGHSASNTQANEATEKGLSEFFFAERTGVINKIRFHRRVNVGPQTGYSDGDGGTYTIEIRAADPVTKAPLTGVQAICKLDNYQPGNDGAPTHPTLTFTTTGSITAKQPYCVIFRNTHSNPGGNYFSTNITGHFIDITNGGGGPPGGPVPAGGWNPITISGISGKFYPWPVIAENGTLKFNRIGPPTTELQYTDGQWTGPGTHGGGSNYNQPVSGTSQLRERFKVTRATRVVTGVYVRITRHNASGGSLVVTLESGPSSDTSGNGTTIEQVTVAASSVFDVGGSETWNEQQAQGAPGDRVPWLWVPFASNRTLTLGSLYNLRFSATGGGDFKIWTTSRSEGAGLSPVSSTWADHEANRTLPWTAWEDTRGTMISTNSGSAWSFPFDGQTFSPSVFKCN